MSWKLEQEECKKKNDGRHHKIISLWPGDLVMFLYKGAGFLLNEMFFFECQLYASFEF